MFFQSSWKYPFFMILWWMELHFISTSIICIMCFLPIMAPNTPCWWLSLNKSVPWTTGTWNNGERLCNFTWNSLRWRCFLALLDFFHLGRKFLLDSTFLAFFLISALITCVSLKSLLCQEVSGFCVIYPLFWRNERTVGRYRRKIRTLDLFLSL